jgi:hypothetical protein
MKSRGVCTLFLVGPPLLAGLFVPGGALACGLITNRTDPGTRCFDPLPVDNYEQGTFSASCPSPNLPQCIRQPMTGQVVCQSPVDCYPGDQGWATYKVFPDGIQVVYGLYDGVSYGTSNATGWVQGWVQCLDGTYLYGLTSYFYNGTVFAESDNFCPENYSVQAGAVLFVGNL